MYIDRFSNALPRDARLQSDSVNQLAYLGYRFQYKSPYNSYVENTNYLFLHIARYFNYKQF